MMTKEEQGLHETKFFCENQPLGLPMKEEGLHETKFLCENQPLGLPMKEENEGETPMNENQSLEDAIGSSKEIVGDEREDGKYRKSDHQMHIFSERQRRKKMSNLFSSLDALLPLLPFNYKADKLTIVDGAMNYINILENIVEKLEKEKRERLPPVSTIRCKSSVAHGMLTSNLSDSSCSTSITQQPVAFQTWCYPNVVFNICGNDAQFCVYTNRQPSLTTTIALVLERHEIEVMSASIMRNDVGKYIYMILAQANGASPPQFPEATSVDEIYKQAAREIMLLIS